MSTKDGCRVCVAAIGLKDVAALQLAQPSLGKMAVKNGIVKICLVESQGGIAPPTKRIIFNFAKEVGSPSAVDRTDYGTASGSARGFAQHHSQQLSRAAVCGDAQNINNAARNMRVAHSFMTGLNAPPPCARAF